MTKLQGLAIWHGITWDDVIDISLAVSLYIILRLTLCCIFTDLMPSISLKPLFSCKPVVLYNSGKATSAKLPVTIAQELPLTSYSNDDCSKNSNRMLEQLHHWKPRTSKKPFKNTADLLHHMYHICLWKET